MRPSRYTKCNLGILLKKRGITQTEAAEYIGVSYQQIQKYASGLNEMSLKTLFDFCNYLQCIPKDIYPEIEFYDKGVNIPISQTMIQDSNEEVHTITNYNYNKPGFFDNFFSNIRLLDINQRGAFLIKSGFILISLYLIAFYSWRALGFHLTDHLSQLLISTTIIIVVLGIIAPLILTTKIVYVLSFAAFRNVAREIYYSFYIDMLHNNNKISTAIEWWIWFVIGILLTLLYAYIVKKYLRKHIGIKNKS